MARPRKEGMDYFPHNVNAKNDKKIEALRSLYGNDGYTFYFIMLEEIYQEKDFQLDVSDAETREEMFQILANKIQVPAETFHKMLQTALRWGAFDKEKYNEDGIITSDGIKKRAAIVTDKRKSMREKYREEKAGVSEAETGVESTQSKVKESKVKESKKEREIKRTYGDSVKLTDKEYQKLLEKLGQKRAEDMIERVDLYINSKGRKYKSHYHTILSWHRRDVANGRYKEGDKNERGLTGTVV